MGDLLAGVGGRRPVAALAGVVLLVVAIDLLTGGWDRPRLPATILQALAQLALTVAVVRRLHGMGRTGWWALLMAVPILNAALVIWTLAAPTNPAPRPTATRHVLGGVALIVLAVLVATRLLWATHTIPSASMAPTLRAGDVILSTRAGAPARGDVVIHEGRDGTARALRVVGLPGETVAMADGVPVIDGTPLAQAPAGEDVVPFTRDGILPRCANAPVPLGGDCRRALRRETGPEGRVWTVMEIGPSPYDDVPPTVLAPGAHWLLGDHRDNAVDGRVPPRSGGPGPVAAAAIRWRPRVVLFNIRGWDRWLEAVE